MGIATAESFAAWAESVGVSVTPTGLQLERANDDVAVTLRGAVYRADADGVPLDADTLAGVRKAAHLQAYAIAASDKAAEDRAQGGPGPLLSASIGGASYTYADAPQSSAFSVTTGLCREAGQALAATPHLYWGVTYYG